MEKDSRYLIVGIFVSMTLLMFVGIIIWLAGTHGFNHYDRYTVYFTDPVGGLTEDATVKYKGVDVGKVLALRLLPEKAELIKVDIEVKDGTPVAADTQVKIEMAGITGQSYLEMSTANPDKPPPQLPDERYPVLKGSGSQLSKLLDDLSGVSKQMQGTLSSINDFAHSGSRTADAIRALADSLKEDPSRVLKGPPKSGVTIPK